MEESVDPEDLTPTIDDITDPNTTFTKSKSENVSTSENMSQYFQDSSDEEEREESIESGENAELYAEKSDLMQEKDKEEGSLTTFQSDVFKDFEFSQQPEVHFNLSPDPDNPDQIRLLDFQKNDMGFNPKEVDLSQVLAADHPLLNKFQKSLKDQLLKKVALMKEQVGDLVEVCRTKQTEKEVLGAEAFETQQTAGKQETSIRECLEQLENCAPAREELEYLLAKVTAEFEFEKQANTDAEIEEINIRTEMESVDLLMKQMNTWAQQLESELMVNQRIVDYTAKTKTQLNEEQKHLDALVFNMMKEVWKLETEVERVQMQIRVKEDDRERLAEAVALANIDIESNQTEHRCLLHGWQSVLVTINQRDKYFNNLQGEFTKQDDLLSDVNSELIHIKKDIQREHIENERLSLIKDRMEYELANVNKALQSELTKRDEYLKMVTQFDKFIEENSRQRELLTLEVQKVKEEEGCLSSELEVLNQAKYQLEQDILIHLQANAFNSDACRQMANVLKDCKEENRRVRINIARVEGQISSTHSQYQTLRMENADVKNQLREMKETIAKEDTELLNIHKDFEKTEKSLSKNIVLYEQLKLKASGDAQQKIQMYPEEIRIRQLEATNAVLMEKNKQSQSFWLREQAIVVELSEKRQAQIKEMDIIKKQILVMDQKNLRINDSIANLLKLEDNLLKSINGLENKMNLCTTGLHKKRINKNWLNTCNRKVQSELQASLEDSEFESLKLKAEIVEIEEDKYQLSKDLIERNREALCWEKKLLMVLDTRKQMHESLSESGELSQMRTEIHRMNVRYSQLKKAQDKLIHDLDNCITRRDSIVTLAEARTRGHKGGSQQWRVNFIKRRDDLRNKITQLEAESLKVRDKYEDTESEYEQCSRDILQLQQDIDELRITQADILERVEQAKINRQLRLDVLLFKQRKLKVYNELTCGRPPFMMYRHPANAHNAYVRERGLNTTLRSLVEELQQELPGHVHFLTKCHNTLTLPAVKL